MNREKNLLFGLFAVREKKAGLERVASAAEKVAGAEDLGKHLVLEAVISEEDRAALESRVAEEIEKHGGDPAATLASLNPEVEFMETLGASMLGSLDELQTVVSDQQGGVAPHEAATVMADPNQLPGSLVPDDPLKTVPTSGGGLSRGQSGMLTSGETVPAVREHEGRYDEIREFAKGGMGKIILVHDTHVGRDVALKTLLSDHVGINTYTGVPTADMLTVPVIARFLQEARVTGQLEHPAIVPVYELGYREDGSLYYTMKFVRGKSLQEAIEKAPTLPDRLPLLNHFLHICQAIAYSHDRGVIHRDLKPLNVMIGEFGETMVIDWGIAKVRGQQDISTKGLHDAVRLLHVGDAEATAKTMYGQTIGSPYYMPPEQAAGRMDEIDERSDVYALGAVLYTILAGKPPYAGTKAREFLTKVADFPPKPVREVEPEAPPELAAICERAMQRKPEDRYPSAKEVMDEVERYLSGGLVSAYEYRFTELAKRFIKKHRRVLTTAAIAAVLLIASGIYYTISVTQQRNIARQQRDRAEVAEEDAVEQRDRAIDAEAETSRKLYTANIALVQRNIDEQQMASARDRLTQCPENRRDWEWGYLQARCNADLMTLPTGGNYVAFAVGGANLITGKANGTVTVNALASGETLRTLVEKAGSSYAMALTEDGSRAVVSGEKALAVWDTETGEELFRFNEPPRVPLGRNHVSMSADGTWIAALNTDRRARVWRMGQEEPVLRLPVDQARGFGILFSPGGDRLFIAREVFGDTGFTRSFEVLQLPGGESLGSGQLQDPLSVHSVAFSPDGGLCALGTDDGLQLWQISPWTLRKTFEGKFRNPDALAFSPDGRKLGAGTHDGDVALWDMGSLDGTVVRKAHEQTVRAVTFSHDGRLLATAGYDRTARLWSASDLRALRVFRGHDRSLFSLAFSPDNKLLVTGAFDGKAKLWDLSAELESALLDDGGFAFHVDKGLVAGTMGTEVGVWDSHSGHRVHTFSGHESRVKALAFDVPGERLATASMGKEADEIRLWDLNTGEAIGQLDGPGNNTEEMVFTCEGGCLAVKSGSRMALLSIARGEEIISAALRAFAFAPNGPRWALARPSEDRPGHMRVWMTSNQTLKDKAFSEIALETAYLAFSSDGTRLLLGGEGLNEDGAQAGRVYWWDLDQANGPRSLEVAESPVSCVAYSPSGKYFASGYRNGHVTIWDGETGAEVRSISGHADIIHDVAFNPEETRLATASQDGTFKFWNLNDGEEFLTLQNAALGAEGQVSPKWVAFGSDARQLITVTWPPRPPIVHHAFPWERTAYPGGAGDLEQKHIETFKREYWR